jgi:ATP-binding protein involved in chromosome partitioning
MLGTVPLDPAVAVAGDSGSPTVISNPDSPAGEALRAVAQELAQAIGLDL